PTSSVGIIEPDGMRNGSATNERSSNTTSTTGNSERAQSTGHGSRTLLPCASARCLRLRYRNRRSTNQTRPNNTVRPSNNAAKSNAMGAPSEPGMGSEEWGMGSRKARFSHSPFPIPHSQLFIHFQNGQERLLGNLHATHLFHAFLAFLLFFQNLALAADIAAIAFGQHVLAQRLDRRARDDLRADGRLDGHVELLARNQLLHATDQIAPAALGVGTMHDQAERVHAIAIDQHVHAHERTGL